MLISNFHIVLGLKVKMHITTDFVFSRNDIVLYENQEEMNFQLLFLIYI